MQWNDDLVQSPTAIPMPQVSGWWQYDPFHHVTWTIILTDAHTLIYHYLPKWMVLTCYKMGLHIPINITTAIYFTSSSIHGTRVAISWSLNFSERWGEGPASLIWVFPPWSHNSWFYKVPLPWSLIFVGISSLIPDIFFYKSPPWSLILFHPIQYILILLKFYYI